MEPANEIVPVGDSVVALDTTATLRSNLLRADERRAELYRAGDWLTLAYAVTELRKVKSDLDALVRETEENVAALLPEKKVAVDGFGVIEKHTTTSRKWESAELMRHLVRSTLDPEGTGEITLPRVFTLLETLAEVLPLTPSLGWRVTALKDRGVDVGEFSDVTYGRSNITIK